MAIILFVVILLVLVVGHELGHFIFAKWVGMRVDEFGVGFPPRVWGRKIGETIYSINILPFGGFVKIFGEDETDKTKPRAFVRAGKGAQAAVLAAGPFANIVLAVIAFWIAYLAGVPTVIESAAQAINLRDERVLVADVLADSPADLAGIMAGDRVVSVDGIAIKNPIDIPKAIGMHGDNREMVIERPDGEHRLTLAPITGLIAEDPDRFGFGIATLLIGTKSYGPIEALSHALGDTGTALVGVIQGLWALLLGALTLSASLSDISGPVGIASLVGTASAFGVGQVLILAAVISLNLAVINLFPFPALDGGRLAMLAVEMVRGKAVKTSTMEMINLAGFALLIALMLVITYHDIAKLIS